MTLSEGKEVLDYGNATPVIVLPASGLGGGAHSGIFIPNQPLSRLEHKYTNTNKLPTSVKSGVSIYTLLFTIYQDTNS